MPRQKKQVLKQRKDGRYCCRYKGMAFFARSSDEALALREDYKRREALGFAAQADGPLILEYAHKWLRRAKAGVADQTFAEAACLLEKLTNHLGELHFREVKPSQIKDVYAEEFVGVSDSYIKSAAQLYRAFFDAALDDGYCTKNPARADSAKPHRGKETEGHRAITAQEREWINSLCTDHRCHPAVMAMLYAGIRPQEAKALDIDRDVDFDAGVLRVRQSVHLSGTNQYTRTEKLKTKQSRREIPLLPPLRAALAGLHGPLVPSADGRPVTVQAWRSAWESYVFSMETAINGCQERWYGTKKEQQGKSLPPFQHFTVVPYDLRHSFCTMCRDNGVEINTCIHWMGHKDAKMILKIYDEFSQERSQREAEKLSQSLFGMQSGVQLLPASDKAI